MSGYRASQLAVGGGTIRLPCFFPSVSSVKTNLIPVDYIELLTASSQMLFLFSAYDYANASLVARGRLDKALTNAVVASKTLLMDSGNYERFWKNDPSWDAGRFHDVLHSVPYHLSFIFDNQDPQGSVEEISREIVEGVLRDQSHASGTVVPIVHAAAELVDSVVVEVATQVYPVLLAVPERALGAGILERARAVRRIRNSLDRLDIYCPLHLLGTGNPLSLATYAVAGADSFDGLEWCQTVVDHETGRLSHFQHWDLFRGQTEWGRDAAMPYVQSVLLHNLEFYAHFMQDVQASIAEGNGTNLIERYAPGACAKSLCAAALDHE